MHEPHKFPRFTIYNLQKDYLPSLHNLTTKYHKHQETTTTHTNHTHNISHYPLHPSHPNFQNKKKSSKILHSIRQGWWRWDTHGAHTIVIHLPTGETDPPTTDPPLLLSTTTLLRLSASAGRLAAFTWGNAWNPGSQWFFIIHDSFCLSSPHSSSSLSWMIITIIRRSKNKNNNKNKKNNNNDNNNHHRYTVSYNWMGLFA